MKVRDEDAGRRAKCPGCGAIVPIPGTPRPAHDVFISYAAEDKPTADAACATLEARGIRCWISPRDVLAGKDYAEVIVDAIGESALMVLVFSSHANDSPHIRREAERAVSKGKPIIPLRIEDVQPSRAMEYFLSTPHWLDALTPPLEQHLEHLAETVQILLKRESGRRPRWRAGATGHLPGLAGRRRPALWIAGMTGGALVLAGVALALIAVLRGVWPGSARPSEPPTDVIQAKAAAEAAWQRARGIPPGEGVGAILQDADAQRRAGEALVERGAYAEAAKAYQAAAQRAEAALRRHEDRARAAAAEEAMRAAKKAAIKVKAEAVALAAWSEAERLASDGRQRYDTGDLAGAQSLYERATAAYRKAAQVVQGLPAVEAARAAYTQELDGYDIEGLLAAGTDGWKQVTSVVASAAASAKEGRFQEAVGAYRQAASLLPAASPMGARFCRQGLDRMDFQNTPLESVLQFFADFSGVPVVADWKAMAAYGIQESTPVSVDGIEGSAALGLSMSLAAVSAKPDRLGWFLRKGQFIFVSSERRIAALRQAEEDHRARRSAAKTLPLLAKMKATRACGAIDSMPLDNVVNFVGDSWRVNLVVRWEELAAAGVHKGEAVSLPAMTVTLDQMLWVLSATVGVSDPGSAGALDYAVADQGYIILSSPSDLAGPGSGKAPKDAAQEQPRPRASPAAPASIPSPASSDIAARTQAELKLLGEIKSPYCRAYLVGALAGQMLRLPMDNADRGEFLDSMRESVHILCRSLGVQPPAALPTGGLVSAERGRRAEVALEALRRDVEIRHGARMALALGIGADIASASSSSGLARLAALKNIEVHCKEFGVDMTHVGPALAKAHHGAATEVSDHAVFDLAQRLTQEFAALEPKETPARP